MAKGIRWRVGDGSSISIYDSRWIPLPWDYKVISPRTLPANSRVSDILEEYYRWHFDNQEVYTVKLAYRLGLEGFSRYDPSPFNPSFLAWWNGLWATKIPPHVRIFWWRVLHNFIETSCNLRNNHIPTILGCQLCGF